MPTTPGTFEDWIVFLHLSTVALLYRPQHFLYFLPLPHGQGALRGILGFGVMAFIGMGTWDAD